MSLGIAFKAPEGIVLAADSRLTFTTRTQSPNNGPILIENSSYDNATKLLRTKCQTHVGAITYGIGAILTPEPRSAHSYMTEFEATISGKGRMTVQEYAEALSLFFVSQWHLGGNPVVVGEDMIFLVGGYDPGATFGKIFQFNVPNFPNPVELTPNAYGPVWGGQKEYVDRLINGHDQYLPIAIQQRLGLTQQQADDMNMELATRASQIPWPFLPLQDCIDLSIFMIRTTIIMQHWLTTVRGVGGSIDVAVITQEGGLVELQKKQLIGEK